MDEAARVWDPDSQVFVGLGILLGFAGVPVGPIPRYLVKQARLTGRRCAAASLAVSIP